MSALPSSFRFPRALRLRKSSEISRTLKEGRRVMHGKLLGYYLPTEEPLTRVAFVVSRRPFRRAVDRNRVKRLMREAYRLQKHLLQVRGGWIVLRFVGKDKPSFSIIHNDLQIIFEKLSCEATHRLDE